MTKAWSSSTFAHFDLVGVKPNKVSIWPELVGWPAPLTASSFNQLGQYASSAGLLVRGPAVTTLRGIL